MTLNCSPRWFVNCAKARRWCKGRRLGFVSSLLVGAAILCLGAVMPPTPPTPPMAALPNATVTPKLRQVTLEFDPSTTPNVNYRIRYGTESGDYPFVSEFGTNTIGSVSNLVDGTRYYFVAHAWNDLQGESDPSNETNWLASGTAIIITFRATGVNGPWNPLVTNKFQMTNGAAFYRQSIIEK